MAHVGGLNFFNFENREELVLAQFEKGVAFARSSFSRLKTS